MLAELCATLLHGLIYDESHPTHLHLDLFGDFFLQKLRILRQVGDLHNCFAEIVPE